MSSLKPKTVRPSGEGAAFTWLLTILIGLLSPFWAASAQDSTTAPTGKSTLTGVFTDVQAKRGESTYKSWCVSCHSAKAYTGEAFKVAWLSRSAFDIFETIRTLMPEDQPGILPRQDYADIVAYLFSLNGYPVGGEELPTDDDGLKRVKIEAMPPGTASSHGSWSAAQIRRSAGR